ncbi:hypothetical protein GCM10020358_18420 [Amorphoplanes nipponensis]|uniref:MYXO-CTERM domain-containing protein n=1 Tax=Actinoplanes nipponensis TaxID=135950 RepID=A0A919MI95_9ACTN|nr:hypothetical protein [Actinoplanes nipponensis]GIE50509.1 hypothetical protein Ani05nite_40430 [Actinoplanes nipponensis]
MPKPTARPRHLLTALVSLLGLVAVLLSAPAPASAGATAPDKLVITWIDHGTQLRVDGFAYRARAVVDVRLGATPLRQTRSDDTGRVQVIVPQELIAAGQSGASIVVAGRSAAGTSRVMISAVPPRAAARGPVDVLPWSVGALLVAGLALGALYRRRSRSAGRTAVAPLGYRRRHAA